MKIGSFMQTNAKGQIVIPKSIRDALGIDANVTLNITLAGKGIYIYPVEEFLSNIDKESSYVRLLEKTKGTWKDEDWNSLRKKRSRSELTASKLRKKLW